MTAVNPYQAALVGALTTHIVPHPEFQRHYVVENARLQDLERGGTRTITSPDARAEEALDIVTAAFLKAEGKYYSDHLERITWHGFDKFADFHLNQLNARIFFKVFVPAIALVLMCCAMTGELSFNVSAGCTAALLGVSLLFDLYTIRKSMQVGGAIKELQAYKSGSLTLDRQTAAPVDSLTGHFDTHVKSAFLQLKAHTLLVTLAPINGQQKWDQVYHVAMACISFLILTLLYTNQIDIEGFIRYLSAHTALAGIKLYEQWGKTKEQCLKLKEMVRTHLALLSPPPAPAKSAPQPATT